MTEQLWENKQSQQSSLRKNSITAFFQPIQSTAISHKKSIKRG